MMNFRNTVILTGRVAREVDIRQGQNHAVGSFTIAVDRNKRKGEKESTADFIKCVAWDNTANFVSKYFPKGTAIQIMGEIRNNNYTDKNGNNVYSYVVNVTEIGFPMFNSGKSNNQQNNNQQNNQPNTNQQNDDVTPPPAPTPEEFEDIASLFDGMDEGTPF